MEIQQLIQEHGIWFYPITFIWTFLEGESFVIFAGAAATRDIINIYWLIFAAWSGSFCGDQLYFFLGRRYGQRIIARWPRLQGGVNVALHMLHRHHSWFILTYRFIYGVRNFASFGMGMSELPWRRFAFLNFFAAGIWANSFAWGGYLLAIAFASILGDVAANFGYLMLGVFVFVVALIAFIHWRGKKRYEAQLAEEAARPVSELEEIVTHPEEVEATREGQADWNPDEDENEGESAGRPAAAGR